MADFAGICVRGRGGGGNDTYRCDPHLKVYFGQVHLWMVHFGVHPPPRGSPRYTKKSGTPPRDPLFLGGDDVDFWDPKTYPGVHFALSVRV